MSDLVNRLREPERWWSCVGPLRGHTQKSVNLTPYYAADHIDKLEADNKRLRKALDHVCNDVLAYEEEHNLYPSGGRKYCWDSVANGFAVLAEGEGDDSCR